MAEGTSNELTGERDLTECYYARTPSVVAGFDTITMRVPAARDRDSELVTETGEAARDAIVKYHLGTTCGILSAAGYDKLARDVMQASRVISGVLSDAGVSQGEGAEASADHS